MQFLGGEERETLGQVETHLVAEDAFCPSSRAVALHRPFVKDAAQDALEAALVNAMVAVEDVLLAVIRLVIMDVQEDVILHVLEIAKTDVRKTVEIVLLLAKAIVEVVAKTVVKVVAGDVTEDVLVSVKELAVMAAQVA